MPRVRSLGFVLIWLSAATSACGSEPAQIRLSDGHPAIVEIFDGSAWVPIGALDRKEHRWLPGQSPELHGADGRCTLGSNDTQALQSFFDAVRDGGEGQMDGCYLVDEGRLVIAPSPGAELASSAHFQSFRAPQLSGSAVFVGRGTAAAPMLSIRNPKQRSGNGSFYAGGTLGNIVFANRSESTNPNVHGLSIQGLYNWSIGQIIGQDLGGSALYISPRTVNGNPDAYGSAGNRIAAAICYGCGGPTFNAATLGEGGQRIGLLAAYADWTKGRDRLAAAMVNGGQATTVDQLAVGFMHGWGLILGAGDQHGNLQTVRNVELNTPENGIWIGAVTNSFVSGRLVYDRIPGSEAVWPKTAVKLGGQGSLIRAVELDLILRIDPGVTLRDIVDTGTLIDLSNDPNMEDVTIRLTVVDHAMTGLIRESALAIPAVRLVKNRNPLARVTLIVNGRTVLRPD